jgi:hypothetical protein
MGFSARLVPTRTEGLAVRKSWSVSFEANTHSPVQALDYAQTELLN